MAILLLLASVFTTRQTFAQTIKGIVTGVVRDKSGAVIPNANVIITGQDTGETRKTTSGSNGAYRVDAINPGRYQIAVEAPGFEAFTVTNLNVLASVVTSYDPTLVVGKVNSTVTVEANSNIINTENGSLSGTVGSVELSKIPIFSLNPIELATTLPGVQVVNAGGTSNGYNIEVNGTRPRANNFLIDGQDINDNSIAGQAVQPNITDSYTQVVVLTNSSSAEYGRGGGAIVNLVSRSGTNQFHGSAWDLYTGSGLNALDGVARQSMTPKTRFDQHQYGFTVGGPIIRNKLFAFGGGQYRRRFGSIQPARLTVPDAAGLANLKAAGGANVNLLLQYLNNITGIDPAATGKPVQTSNIGAHGTCVDPCAITYGYYTRPAPALQSTNTQWTYKVDYLMTQKDTFAFRYLHDRSVLSPDFFNFPGSLPGLETNQGGPDEQFGATYTHVFNQNLLNEFRASETRIDFRFGVPASTVANPLFSKPTITADFLPTLGVPSNIPQGRGHDTYQFQDTIAFTKGRQTIRAGADVARLIVRDFIPFNFRGTLNYSASTGYTALANFVDDYLGVGGNAAISFGNNRVDAHIWQTGYFFQDDIKMTPDFTFNVGLRYEYDSNPENSLTYPAINPATALTDPYNAVIKVNEDTNNLAPRLGFAYSPHNGAKLFGNGKTVFRGGFGVFYDTVFTNITDNSQGSSPNVAAGLTTSTVGRGVANGSQQIAMLTPAPSPFNAVTSVTNNQVNPLTYQYNFGMERELPLDFKMSLFYVGTRGQKLFASQQYNYFSNGARFNKNRGQINARGNFADSNYNSLQLGVNRDFRNGLLVTGAYTFGKGLDDGTDIFGRFDTPTPFAANLAPNGRGAEYGRSAYDHRHELALAYVWAVPGVHSSNAALNTLLAAATRNWVVSGTSTFQTGPPTTASLNQLDTNGDGTVGNDRPSLGNPAAAVYTAAADGKLLGGTYMPGILYDITPVLSKGQSYPTTTADKVRWLIQPGTGNVGRNSVPSPGILLNNVAVEKDIPLSFIHHLEGHAFQFRVEAQDVANHNNVGPYNTNVLALRGAQGGTTFENKSFSRENDGRILRLWAKYAF